MKQLELKAGIAILGSAAQLRQAGVTEPPGLSVNGTLLFQGFVPSLQEVMTLLAEAQETAPGS